MQFKKLAAITGSALMAGLSLAAPVLATSVTALKNINTMVSASGNTYTFPTFVIGATAATSDVAGAVDMAVNLASNAVVTKQVTVSGAGESVTGGVKIRTVGSELTPYTGLRTVKTVLTNSDMDILAGGTFYLSSGTSGTYKEYLYLGGTASTAATTQPAIKYATATGEVSPSLYLDIAASNVLYEYLLAFPTSISFTANSDLIGTTITMMGKSFAISDVTTTGTAPALTLTSVTMLGGGIPVSVETGASKTVTMNSKDYAITLTSVGSESISGSTYYSAIGDVNGESFQIRAGQTKTLSDGTTIGATKVFAPIVAGQSGYASMTIGGAKYVISTGSTVTKDGQSVTGLVGTITSTATASAGKLSSITLDYTPNSETFIKGGQGLTDVFASAFNMKFNSLTPEFDDTTNRQTIQFASSGPTVRLTYVNADGETEALDVFYNSGGTMVQGRTSTIAFVTDEKTSIGSSTGDYFLVSSGGFSHILQFTSFDSTNQQLTFTDTGTGQSSTVSYTLANNYTSIILDGFSYAAHIVSSSSKTIQVDMNRNGAIANWTVAAAAEGTQGGAGTEFSYFVPKLITTGQGGLYLYRGNQTITPAAGGTYANIGMYGFNVSNSSLVAGALNVGTTLIGAITGSASATVINNVTGTANDGYLDIVVTCAANMTSCNVGLGTSAGMQTSPGFILVQEALQGSTTHDWLFFPVTYSSALVRAGVSSAATDDANLIASGFNVVSGSTTYKGMSTYGTYAEYDTTTMSASVKYPDSFTYGNIYVLSPTGTISTSGTAGSVTTQTVLPITSDVVKLDSEITATDKTSKDLILVGGPCINTLVADLATAGKFPYTCANWPGRNFGKIQLISDAFATGQTALVVAGTRAADTDLASLVVQGGFTGATDTQKAGSSIEVTGTVSSPAYS
jgi:hypothetical protein